MLPRLLMPSSIVLLLANRVLAGVGDLAAPEVADGAIAASEDIEAADIAIVGAYVREFVSYSTKRLIDACGDPILGPGITQFDIRNKMMVRSFSDPDLLEVEDEIIRINKLIASHRRRCRHCKLRESRAAFLLRKRSHEEIAEYDIGFQAGSNAEEADHAESQAW